MSFLSTENHINLLNTEPLQGSSESHDCSSQEIVQMQRPTKQCIWCLGVCETSDPHSWLWNQRPPEPWCIFNDFQNKSLHHSVAFHFRPYFFFLPFAKPQCYLSRQNIRPTCWASGCQARGFPEKRATWKPHELHPCIFNCLVVGD